jgi:hypothetical protein
MTTIITKAAAAKAATMQTVVVTTHIAQHQCSIVHRAVM